MKGKGKFRLKLLISLLAVVILFIVAKYYQDNISIPELLKRVEKAGFWAPASFTLLYILISGILIPSIVLRIFAGTLFGVVWGLVLASVAAIISSSLKFLLARYLFRDSILKRVEKSKKLRAIDQVIERDGWKALIILRNIPVVNSMVLNYICGLTKMKLKTFVLASFIGRLPTTIMYVYLGYMLRYTYAAGSGKQLMMERIALFIGLLAIAGSTLYLIYLSRKILSQKAPAITTFNEIDKK